MKPEEIRKLLGGYATGTLTEAERNLLFTAALENQALFDALADEESLRELLDDPTVRGQLLAVIDEKGDPTENVDWRQAQPAMRVQPSSMQPSAMPASPPAASATPDSRTSRRPQSFLTPPRIAFAGALAAAILVVAVVVSIERNRLAAPVEIAESRQSASPREESPAKQIAPATASQPTQNAPAGPAEKRPAEAATSQARRDAVPAAPPQISSATSTPQRSAPEPAEPLSTAKPNAPAADERQRSAEGGVNAGRDASKESERKTEQKDAQAEPAIEANAVPPSRIAPAPIAAAPPSPSAAKKAEESDLASKRQALTQGFAGGMMSKSRAAGSSRLAATVTDINGTIVSVNAGTDAGLKNTDTLEIVRDGAVLGTVRLTDTRPTFAVGTLTRSPGAGPPRAGDSVRLQAAPPVR